jgi:hypothetical protein
MRGERRADVRTRDGERRKLMKQVRKYAPFLSARWWLLHTGAIAAVYAAGSLLAGR